MLGEFQWNNTIPKMKTQMWFGAPREANTCLNFSDKAIFTPLNNTKIVNIKLKPTTTIHPHPHVAQVVSIFKKANLKIQYGLMNLKHCMWHFQFLSVLDCFTIGKS